jgi:hypothetical protein
MIVLEEQLYAAIAKPWAWMVLNELGAGVKLVEGDGVGFRSTSLHDGVGVGCHALGVTVEKTKSSPEKSSSKIWREKISGPV